MSKKQDLPAMPFYPGDWFKAPDIQALPYDLKGLWLEMLFYMWESNERGYLVDASGKPFSQEELSRLLRLPEDLLKQKLEQLRNKNIFSLRAEDSAIYSRRMVKDNRIREIRKKSGAIGGKKSVASKFAQAKREANAENENVHENEINKEEGYGGKDTKSDKKIRLIRKEEKSIKKYNFQKGTGDGFKVFSQGG